jgi:hypothetical protein
MARTLANDGDLFERQNADWITEHLPVYQSLWAEYIGNDGENRLSSARLVRPEWSKNHQLFAQAHYTMATSGWLLWRHTDSILAETAARIATESPLKTAADHLAEVQKLFLFMGYVGNIIDQVDKMQELTGVGFTPEASDRLAELKAGRHAVIHGARIPTQQDYELWVPPLIGRMQKPEEWSGKMAWAEVPGKNYEPLSQFCERTRTKIFTALVSVHGALKDGLGRFFEPQRQPAPGLGGYSRTDRGPPFRPVGIEEEKSLPSGDFSSGAQSTSRIIRPSGDANR